MKNQYFHNGYIEESDTQRQTILIIDIKEILLNDNRFLNIK